MRDFSTSPHVRSASIARRYPGATGDAFLDRRARMKDSTSVIAGAPDDLFAPDDEGLLAFTDTLRRSVRARVGEDLQRGLPLSEIVDEVREMVRLAQADARKQNVIPPRVFPAILRQALGWCIEAYRPAAVTADSDDSACPHGLDPKSSPAVPALVGHLPMIPRLRQPRHLLP